MAYIAIEAIKVKLDSDGTEVIYEPKTDVATLGVGRIVEAAKIMNTLTGVETVVEPNSISGAAPSAITDFVATGGVGETVVTFSETTGSQPTDNALWMDSSKVASGISSGYTHTVAAGTYDYYVKATNAFGSTDSNTDSATVSAAAQTVFADNGEVVLDDNMTPVTAEV